MRNLGLDDCESFEGCYSAQRGFPETTCHGFRILVRGWYSNGIFCKVIGNDQNVFSFAFVRFEWEKIHAYKFTWMWSVYVDQLGRFFWWCFAFCASFTRFHLGSHITGHPGPVESTSDKIQNSLSARVAHFIMQANQHHLHDILILELRPNLPSPYEDVVLELQPV